MPTYRLGKHPKRVDARTLQFRNYLTDGLPPPPMAVTYERAVKYWPVMGNNDHQDCTVAAAGHLVEDWTANTRAEPVVIPETEILAAYRVVSGGEDSGAAMLTVLKYWRKTGIAGHRIDAFAEVSKGHHAETRQAVAIFGGAYVGLGLPDFAAHPPDGNLDTVPWAVPASGVQENPPNPHNGHCVPIVGYDAKQFWVVTWGKLKSMTPEFYAAYSDEVYAVLSPYWSTPGLPAPPGFNLKQLQADLSKIQ